MALAVAVAGRGCGGEDDEPEAAARAFDEAARAGDRDAVFELLGPATQEALEQRAARASELDEHRYEPLDMVALGTGDDERASFELERRDGDSAIVNVVRGGKVRGQLSMVRIDGSWRVELIPPE